jgi:enterochelin esterase-like enzyme
MDGANGVSDERKRRLTRRAFLTVTGVAAFAILAARLGRTSPAGTTAPPVPATTAPTPTASAVPTNTAPPPARSTVPGTRSVAAHTPVPPSASQVLNRTLASAALGREMPYFIYLPVGYTESGLRYPVLYMLHGHGGSNTEWIAYGLLHAADTLIGAGQIPPLIIVLPQGDQSFFVNHVNNGPRWGDYTAQDVVQYIDATYRTILDTQHRAIGGLSMGADGAMQLAMNYPGVFGVVGMHSLTPRDYQAMAAYASFFGDEAYFNAHDPVYLVQQYPDRARALQLWLDVGANDTAWHASDVAFHNLLSQLAIPHTWNGDWPGIHDGNYWGAHVADYLSFYGAALANA